VHDQDRLSATKPQPSNQTEQHRSTLKRVYVPPDPKLISQLAQEVCGRLGEFYQQPEIVEGLTEFLTVVADLTANAMTNGKASWVTETNSKKENQK
jgi:hypothetical protein